MAKPEAPFNAGGFIFRQIQALHKSGFLVDQRDEEGLSQKDKCNRPRSVFHI